jgi:hypothetical protein
MIGSRNQPVSLRIYGTFWVAVVIILPDYGSVLEMGYLRRKGVNWRDTNGSHSERRSEYI